MSTNKSQKSEPIAILGIGCRFPGGVDSADSFWKLLCTGECVVGEVPPDRDWALTHSELVTSRRAAFIEDYDVFDAAFFNISPREAVHMDPQQRIFLQVAWEAIEHAGIDPMSLRGSRTGVYAGIIANEYLHRFYQEDMESISAHTLTGNIFSLTPGRVSYHLGLKGPSMAVSTACSSSLLSVHLAVQSLRMYESDMALAGGVNLIMSPEGQVMLSQIRAISPDGTCSTFDASANGYGRGEGCGVVVLQRLSSALKSNRRILAVIRGSGVNNDGGGGGVTVPNGSAQRDVIRLALADAQLESDDVEYVECHGTGTQLGDPIEIRALGGAYGAKKRPRPLVVGSVKGNIGHCESAAGIAGFIKMVLAIYHRQIPQQGNFRTVSPKLNLGAAQAVIADTPRSWHCDTRYAGVSAFGFSGTNVHMIASALDEVEIEAMPSESSSFVSGDRPFYVLPLSASSEKALVDSTSRLRELLLERTDVDLADICYSYATGKAQLDVRKAFVFEDRVTLMAAIDEFLTKPSGIRKEIPNICFIFGASGASPMSGVKQIYDAEPCFANVIEQCDAVAVATKGVSLRDVLWGDKQQLRRDREWGLPVHYALQIGLTKLWMSWGLNSAILLGPGSGLFSAAHISGSIQLEDGFTALLDLTRLTPGTDHRAILKVIERMPRQSPSLPLISGFNATFMNDEICSDSYWCDHLRKTSYISEYCKVLADEDINLLIEIGEDETLLNAVKEQTPIAEGINSCTAPGASSLYRNLARVWEFGVDIRWEAYYAHRACANITIPAYPFEKTSYHFSFRRPDVSPRLGYFLDTKVSSPLSPAQYAVTLSHKQYPELADTKGLVHIGMYVEMIKEAALDVGLSEDIALRDLRISKALLVSEEEEVTLQLVVSHREGEFYNVELFSCKKDADQSWEKHLDGLILPLSSMVDGGRQQQELGSSWMTAEAFYSNMRNRSIDLGESVQWIRRIQGSDVSAVARLKELDDSHARYALGYHPGVLDSLVQMFYATFDRKDEDLYLFQSFREGYFSASVVSPTQMTLDECHPVKDGVVGGDLTLLNAAGSCIGKMKGVQLVRTSKNMIDRLLSGKQETKSAVALSKSSLEKAENPKEFLIDVLLSAVSAIARIEVEAVEPDMSLLSLGFDSLMSSDLRDVFEKGLGMSFELAPFLDGTPICELAELVLNTVNENSRMNNFFVVEEGVI